MKKIFFTLAALAALASCHKDADNGSPVGPVPGGQSFISISPVTTVVTKAPIADDQFPESRTFMLNAYHNAAEGESDVYFKGVTFQKNADTVGWGGGKYWPTTGTLDFLALSSDGLTLTDTLYAANAVDSIVVGIPDNSSVQCDILAGYCLRQSRSTTSATSMKFRHTCAALMFMAKTDVERKKSENLGITIDSIKVNSAFFSGKLKVVSDSTNAGKDSVWCQWRKLDSKKDVFLLDTAASKGKNLGYDVPKDAFETTKMGIGGNGIIVPEQTEVGWTMYFTLHNGKNVDGSANDQPMVYTWKPSPAGTWDEGKKYNYRIYIKQNEIIVDPKVVDWDTVEKNITIGG